MATASNPYATPSAMPSPMATSPQPTTGDATGGLIPYKNPQALTAYYLGIFSLVIPFMGIASLILGCKGLQARKKNKAIKGSAHAVIGIGCGGFSSLLWGAIVIALLVSWLSQR